MLRLHLATTAADRHANMSAEESQVLHGTAVLQRLVGPWAGSDRSRCADSYYSSVGAALALKGMDLRLIGVVKTAHRRFPKALWGKPPVRGDTTPQHEPRTGRDRSCNTPLGG